MNLLTLENKRKMKKTFIISVLVFLYLISNAQHKITGNITDQNSRPLVGATIFIPEINKGTYTNENGNYELKNIPQGKFKIVFSYIGFAEQIIPIEIIADSLVLNLTLNQSAIESETVIVTSGYNSTQHENAAKIEKFNLTSAAIKDSPNFMKTLTQIPGVSMISKGSGISKPVIRGLSMNDILVLNNGVRFENYQYSSHHPLGIDEFGIESVEVIKGPASLLYGSDAIGGVINFIKEKPAAVGTIIGDYNCQLFSNTQGITNNLGIKGASNKFFGGVRIGEKSNADFKQGGGEFVPNSRFNELSFKSNIGLTNKYGTSKLFYDFNNQKLGLVEDEAIEEITEIGRKNEIWYQEFNTHLLSLQNKYYVGKYKLEFNSAYQNTELIHFAGVNEYELQMQLATLTYEVKFHLPISTKLETILGFQGLNQANTNINNRETILIPDAQTNNYSGFGLIQYHYSSKLKLQTGIRYDHKNISTQAVGSPLDINTYRESLDKTFNSYSGSFGGTYKLTKELLLRANTATAYRTPNIAELTSNGQHELRYELGNKNLVPENSFETDLSIHYHKENYTFDIAGFYNKINNYIYISPTGEVTSTNINIYKYKQENSVLYGSEYGFHIHPKSTKWLHIETSFATVIGKQENGDYLPFIPAHNLQLELRLEKSSFLFFKDVYISGLTNSHFKQNNSAPDETSTNSYNLVDIKVGGNVKVKKQKVAVSISANNIFDTKYIDHLSTLKEANLFDKGRDIAFNISIPFGVKNK